MAGISSVNSLSNKEMFQTNSTMKTYFSKLIKNVSTIAIPIFGIILLNNLPTAEANKFTDCVENCDKFDGGLTKVACYALCGILSWF